MNDVRAPQRKGTTATGTHQRVPCRVLSNLYSLGSEGNEHVNNHYIGTCRNGFERFIRLLITAIRSYSSDVVFFDCASVETLLFALLKYLLPFNRCKLVTADLVLRMPKTRMQRVAARLKRLALGRVQLFILYHRDCNGYAEYYGINPERVIYVPFKVNALELVKAQIPANGLYIFSGGVSLRDWHTLAQAVRGLDVKVVIVTPIKLTETDLSSGERTSSNITIEHDDGSISSWIQYIAESKFVVLPISADSIAASGISTYLLAMALRKCVIITEGPATKGILLNHENCVIVPPCDPDALRMAIQLVDTHDEFRERLAEAGYRYAMSLGDTNRLYRDFTSCILTVADAAEEG